MGKAEKAKTIEDNRKKYRVPGGTNYMFRAKNAVFISPSNTLRHEIAKLIGGYALRKVGDIPNFSPRLKSYLIYIQKEFNEVIKDFPKDQANFITEAVAKKEGDRRVDLVRLDDDVRFEFETSKKIKKENCITIYI